MGYTVPLVRYIIGHGVCKAFLFTYHCFWDKVKRCVYFPIVMIGCEAKKGPELFERCREIAQ